jgi:hypothetical protein
MTYKLPDDLQQRITRKWFERHKPLDRSIPAIRSFLSWSSGEISLKKIAEFLGLDEKRGEYQQLRKRWKNVMSRRGVKVTPYKITYEEVEE